MLNSIQLEDKAQEFLIQAKGEKKSAIKNELIAFANALRDFKGLINNGETEMYFQKHLTKTENTLNLFIETYYDFKNKNSVEAKVYAKKHGLHELEFSIKCLRYLLGIKHKSIL
jgi:hypothetical protein